jgi:hypothetical protein|uniref:Uncharacterized protein n=1 Tax=Myoviridae sp. ctshb19 TaxID=2825194 RepID=A0A8S5UGB4_9CAUD|nr:MAG TPA: hypothetical protein [Myoviridae sp. ctshb19]
MDTPPKKKPRNGDRSNTTGDRHYASHQQRVIHDMNQAFTRKANGLHRLEVALFKWLGKDGQAPEVRAALDQARAAQQDTDFKPLWDLLDERARNTGTGSEEHY